MSFALVNFVQPSGLSEYMGDVTACSAMWEAPLRLLDMFRALQAAGSRFDIKVIQNHFGPRESHYLGHVLSSSGIRIGEDRIRTVVDLKTPITINELRSVLCTIGLVRKFIPNLATLIKPVVALTRRPVGNL